MLLVFFAGGIAWAQSGEWEVRYGFSELMPREDDVDGTGHDVNVVNWFDHDLGVALSVGKDNFEPNYRANEDGIDFSASGDADLTSAGLSLFYRPELVVENLLLTWSLGLRYVDVDSGVAFAVDSSFGGGRALLDVDYGVVTRVGFDLGLCLGEHFCVFAGAGYQFNLIEPEAKLVNTTGIVREAGLEGVKLDDLSLETALFTVGASLRF